MGQYESRVAVMLICFLEAFLESHDLGKIDEYFRAGVRLVWVIDPPTRTAEVYMAVDQRTSLTEGEALDGRSVLPGFTLALRRLFERAGRQRGR